MKKLLILVEKDYVIFLLVLMGAAMLLFPDSMVPLVPWILGLGLLTEGVTGLISLIRYHYVDVEATAGECLIDIVLGIATLLQSPDKMEIIGVLWAVYSMEEAADEINEAFHEKHISPLKLLLTLITLVLALMLLFDPAEHFVFHVRILGIEVITSVLVHRHKLLYRPEDIEAA